MGYIAPRRPSGDASHSSLPAVSASFSGVCSTMDRSGRAGSLITLDSKHSSPSTGWSISLRICPASSMSRRSHSSANSALAPFSSAATAWNPSSSGLARQAARNCATTVRAFCSQLRALRSKAEKGPLGRSQTSQTKQEITQAGAFLTWLADRGRTIGHCQQADLDAWHTEKLATRRPAQTFLRWCMKTSRMSRLTLPPQVINQDQAPLHQHRRLAILRRALNDDSLPLRARVAAALALLYAQPVTRIVRLTVDDVLDDGATVAVRLGDPPSPLPEPVADLMRAYIQSCQHLPYASSRSSQWLFPGRQPGQPMNPVSLQVHLREIGVPPQRGRTSAIRQLVLQAPAPVIAKALGYHDKTATRLVTEAGGTWSRYAPGDHERRR